MSVAHMKSYLIEENSITNIKLSDLFIHIEFTSKLKKNAFVYPTKTNLSLLGLA